MAWAVEFEPAPAITGIWPQPNKAIVGRNAFAHEAGIHQHGVLSNPLTYEIMTPADIGVPASRLVLGKHSGRHAFKERAESLGYSLSEAQLNDAFEKFKILADKKKSVFDEDVVALVDDEIVRAQDHIMVKSLRVMTGVGIPPSAEMNFLLDT